MKPHFVLFPVGPIFVAVFAFAEGHLFAQRFKVEEVADIVPGPDPSHPGYFTSLGSVLVFTARDPSLHPSQRAVFKTDGRTVERIGEVRYGINQSSLPSFPRFAELNGELFFPGIGSNGNELYKTDGVQVVEVADINPGSANSHPRDFTRLGDELFFSAAGPNGPELYKTNGTDVTRVGDVFAPQAFSRLGEELILIAIGPDGREPYKTDGVSTTQLADLNPGPADSFYPSPILPVFHEIGGRLVFSATGSGGLGLYSTDGTDVIELNVEPSAIRQSFAKLGDHLFFAAVGPDGEELFKTDGLTVTQAADIYLGPDSSSPGPFTEFKGELYFPARGTGGLELYRTDGNSVHLVADLGAPPFGSAPADLRAFKDELYFTALGPAGFDLYKTDGTNVVALDINPNGDAFFGGPGPVPTGVSYAEFNGHLFFKAIGPNGWELFSTDGDSIFNYGINAWDLTEFNGELFFSGEGANGFELYKISVVPESSSVALLFMTTLIAISRLGRTRSAGCRGLGQQAVDTTEGFGRGDRAR